MILVQIACRHDLALFDAKERLSITRPLHAPAYDTQRDAFRRRGCSAGAEHARGNNGGSGERKAGSSEKSTTTDARVEVYILHKANEARFRFRIREENEIRRPRHFRDSHGRTNLYSPTALQGFSLKETEYAEIRSRMLPATARPNRVPNPNSARATDLRHHALPLVAHTFTETLADCIHLLARIPRRIQEENRFPNFNLPPNQPDEIDPGRLDI